MEPNKDTNNDREMEKKTAKPFVPPPSENAPPATVAQNPALGEMFQRLYPEMRRPKPNQEAVAAALQAMQRLTMEVDSEAAAGDQTSETHDAPTVCGVCGHQNREGNKFCGACGLSLESAAVANSPARREAHFQASPSPMGEREVHPGPGDPAAAHHYHHHYHHHYFQGGQDFSPAPRANAPESAREADRLRVVAAAKGEPMSRGEAAVRRLTQEWVLACNTRQLDELIELYAADAMVLRPNLPPIRGAMAVRDFFFASLEAGLGEVAVDPVRVEVSGDLAHEVGRYSALVPGTTGKRREERGKYLWVFAKQANGDWKLISECWSSDQTLTTAESDIPKTAISTPSKTPPRRT